MKIIIPFCLTLIIFIGSAGVSESADFQVGLTLYESGDYEKGAAAYEIGDYATALR